MKELKNDQNDVVKDTTISVDDEGNELSKEDGVVAHKDGDVKFNDKTYMFVETQTDEANKITKHVYTRVKTIAKNDKTGEVLDEKDGRFDYPSTDAEFNGVGYSFLYSTLDKGVTTYYYNPQGAEYTIRHYLINTNGELELYDEYKTRNIDGPPRYELIWKNGKSYFREGVTVDEKNHIHEYEYLERQKVGRHVLKGSVDFTIGAKYELIGIPETELEPRQGVFELNGKYYKFTNEPENLNTINEQRHDYRYFEYEVLAKVTKHVIPNGIISVDENEVGPKQGTFEYDGKTYEFDKTEADGDVTTHYYKEVVKTARHLISGTDEQIEVTEGNIEPKQGEFEFNGKKYILERTDDSDPYNIKHYYKESIDRKSKHKIVTSQGSIEIPKLQVAEDGQFAKKDGVTYKFLRKVDVKGTDVYYYMQYDNHTPIEELKIIRSIDLDGNELEVEAGEKEPKVGVVKFGKKEYTFEKTVTADGITTHYYKVVEFEIPKDVPIEQETYVIITRHVTPDGEEFASEIGSTEYKKTIVSYNGKQYQFDRTEVKGDVVTHYYKLVEEQKPSDAPIVPKDELKVTRSVDMDGNELLFEEGTVDAKQGVVKFKGKEYTFERTEIKDGITTHYYKAVESKVPSDAPSVDKGVLEITRFVTPDGTLLEVRQGTLNIKGGKLTFNGKEYEYVSTEYSDGITTHIFKSLVKDTTKPIVNVKIPNNVKHPTQTITKLDVQAKKQLPETGDPITTSVAGLVGLGLAGVLRKRK